jgi:hypothetical protein
MYSFTYVVTLRIWHPGIDAASIVDTLGLASHPVAPGRSSYWRHRYQTNQDCECAAFVRDAARSMMVHSDFLHRIRSTGGRVEFFIGWASERNFGDTFPHDTLALLAHLQIDLSFDVYPDREQISEHGVAAKSRAPSR